MAKIVGKLILGLALCLVLAGCKTQLYGNLREDEANLVLAALLDAGIAAEKVAGEENLYGITVDDSVFAQAMAVLDQRGLPPARHETLGTVFGKDAMFSTPMEERARYLFAMQEELSRTISEIDGVLTSRVHLVLPEKDQMGQDLHVPSAAVFVKHVDDPRHDPAPHRLEIRRLVAAAVPDLAEDRIVVSFFPARQERPAAAFPRRNGGLADQLRSLPPLAFYAIFGLAALLAAAIVALVAGRRGGVRKGGDKP